MNIRLIERTPSQQLFEQVQQNNHATIADLCIYQRANIHYVDPQTNMTALQFASTWSFELCVIELLDLGADPYGRGDRDQTSFELANNDEIIALLRGSGTQTNQNQTKQTTKQTKTSSSMGDALTNSMIQRYHGRPKTSNNAMERKKHQIGRNGSYNNRLGDKLAVKFGVDDFVQEARDYTDRARASGIFEGDADVGDNVGGGVGVGDGDDDDGHTMANAFYNELMQHDLGPQQQPAPSRAEFVSVWFRHLLLHTFDRADFIETVRCIKPHASLCASGLDLLVAFNNQRKNNSHCFHFIIKSTLFSYHDGLSTKLGKTLAHANGGKRISWDSIVQALVFEINHNVYTSLQLVATSLGEAGSRCSITKSRSKQESKATMEPELYAGAWQKFNGRGWAGVALSGRQNPSTTHFRSPFFQCRTTIYDASRAQWSEWGQAPQMLLEMDLVFHLCACYFAVIHTRNGLTCFRRKGEVQYFEHAMNSLIYNDQFNEHLELLSSLKLHLVDVVTLPLSNVMVVHVTSDPLRIRVTVSQQQVKLCGSYERAIGLAWFKMGLYIMQSQLVEFQSTTSRFPRVEKVWKMEGEKLLEEIKLFRLHGQELCTKVARRSLTGKISALWRGVPLSFKNMETGSVLFYFLIF